MKKGIILITVLTAALFVYAQPRIVSPIDADSAAHCWLRTYYPDYSFQNSLVIKLESPLGFPVLYEVSTDSVAVLMSAVMECRPILGVYKHGNISLIKDYISGDLPCSLNSFIEEIIQQIKFVYDSAVKDSYYEKDWQILIAGQLSPINPFLTIGPLIQTKWGQGRSNDEIDTFAYNYYCPPDSGCTHCKAGCVALAMSQIMNYWRAPLIQYEHYQQFDWCNMPIELRTDNPNYIVQRNAVAHLIRECGNRVNMSYGCSGSAASTYSIVPALRHYGYNDSIQYIARGNSNTLWYNMLKNHIDFGIPVIYRGTAPNSYGGHAFICDGYNCLDQFHFNWGWQGRYNGFFSLDAITPTTYNFSYHQSAIFYTYPTNDTNFCNWTVQLNDFYPLYYYHQGDTSLMNSHQIVPQTASVLVSASITQDSAHRTIYMGDTASYFAHREIVLQNGFEAQRGSDFTAEIVPCPNCEENTIHPIHPIFDSLWPTRDSSDILDNTAKNAERYGHMNTSAIPSTDLFPNPTSGELTVKTDGMAQSIIIYNTSGYPVGGWDLLALTDGWLTIDVTTLPAGPYIITVSTASGNTAARFVKK